MSNQRKNTKKAPPKKAGGGVFVGIVIGLMLGAVFAAGVAWYLTRSNPFVDQTSSTSSPDRAPLTPKVLPGKPGDRPLEKPEFDFYKILPKGDGSVDIPTDGKPAPTEARPAEKLYLQVGAFEDPTEADNLKARLALMGVEASVQRGESATAGTVHRVRLGPYARLDDLNAVRAELARAGIESNLVRVK
ncbi:SPOR domain-containing protein [Nitrogeniibacter aestuarii]|uniref:SPOR domain-containing protein n=1 Tax=Nitrogeniibacter aestuarii TaxID=2815343 RepID=UPI001D12950F|nr:SPOR domain-containing protein [Nitrogeniibacter aestuarii]